MFRAVCRSSSVPTQTTTGGHHTRM